MSVCLSKIVRTLATRKEVSSLMPSLAWRSGKPDCPLMTGPVLINRCLRRISVTLWFNIYQCIINQQVSFFLFLLNILSVYDSTFYSHGSLFYKFVVQHFPLYGSKAPNVGIRFHNVLVWRFIFTVFWWNVEQYF